MNCSKRMSRLAVGIVALVGSMMGLAYAILPFVVGLMLVLIVYGRTRKAVVA